MSLYNNVESGIIEKKPSPGTGLSVVEDAALGVVKRHVPAEFGTVLGAVSDIGNGNLHSLGMRVIGSGVLDKAFSGASGIASQLAYWGSPVPLFGGITPREAKKLYDQMRGLRFSKKNLWLLEVSSRLSDKENLFNLFATEVEYAPFTITGDKHKVGGAVVDSVKSSEPVELRLTTLDDQNGTIKRWFENHVAAVVAEDGTVGVPGAYAITIKVVHAFISRGSVPKGKGGKPISYENIGQYRPSNLEISLSRREDGLQEVQMTFSQLDTFMRPS